MPLPAPPAAGFPPSSDNARWTATLLAYEFALLRGLIAPDLLTVWLAPMVVPATAGNATVLGLSPSGWPRLSGGLRQDADAWPLLDESVDQVVIQHLGELGDCTVLLDEALRVLRPEGLLWWTGFGRFGLGRMRFAAAESRRCGVLLSITPLAIGKRLRNLGCVDISCTTLQQDHEAKRMAVGSAAQVWSELVMLRARKRRNATILSGRRRQSFNPPAIGTLGASPASRSGLAA